jgi:hypothetical protein
MSQIQPSEQTKDLPLAPNSIETIDGAFLEYVEKLNLFCDTINGRSKVPVIWSSAERSFQIKDNSQLRDKNGTLIPPIISLERTSITKDPNKKGSFQAGVSPKNDRYYVTKILNQDKTSNFANADTLRKTGQLNFQTSKKNKKIVYQHVELRMPVYVTVEYKINILTNYQSQMNEIIQPFIALTAQNYFVITKDNYRFEAFMDPSFSQDSIAELGEEERKYKSTITVKVLGQIVGEGTNKEGRNAEIMENGFLKTPRENVILDVTKKKKRKEIKNIDTGSGEQINTGVAIKKSFIIGNGVDTQYILQHDFGSQDMFITMRENFFPYQKVEFYVLFQDKNHVLIDTGDPINTNSYVVVLVG